MIRSHVSRRWTGLALTGMFLALALLITGAVPAAAREDIGDEDIGVAVANELLEDEIVQGYLVDVSVEEGIVTLSGTVDNLATKRRATLIAETVRGVRSVINDLTVSPTGLEDDEIQQRVQATLITDPAADAYDIETTVSDNTVRLEGEVTSWHEKRLAAKIAASVAGVQAVENDIEVAYETTRGDREIKEDIMGTLRWDALVDDGMVRIQVDDGFVTLKGTVGSAAEKRRAIHDAWVAGVHDVDAGELKVERWARDQDMRKDKYVPKSDEEVAQAITEALVRHPRTSDFDIRVTVDEGIVTLQGTVDNLKAKRAAAMTARHTVGVWRVKNYLKVRPGTPSDEQLEEQVAERLAWNPRVQEYDINVKVKNGVVTLDGTVNSYHEKAEADDVAARVYGVVEVENKLNVNDDISGYAEDPYIDESWEMYNYEWYYVPHRGATNKSDWEIKEDVHDEFFWSPFVDGSDITVKVDDGIVTLEGTVENMGERMRAAENALEAGASAVDNDLKVKYGPEQFRP